MSDRCIGFSGDNGELKSVLLRESASTFKMYATGRRFCQSFTATLDLRKRQDLLSYAYSLVSPSDDELNIEIEMNESAMPPLVLAVAPPKTARAMLKDEENKGETACLLTCSLGAAGLLRFEP